MKFFTYFFALTLPICSGCQTAHRDAQKLSRETLAELVTYDAQLRRSSDNMLSYYKATLSDLENEFFRMTLVGNRSHLLRKARESADDMSAYGYTDARFHAFLEGATGKAYQELDPRIASLIQEARKFAKELELDQANLKKLRADLEALQADRSPLEIIGDLRPIVQQMETLKQEK